MTNPIQSSGLENDSGMLSDHPCPPASPILSTPRPGSRTPAPETPRGRHGAGQTRIPYPGPRLGWGMVAAVLLLQFWSRYVPSPMAVFVADDWMNWARSSFYSSHLEAFLTGLQDPNRPLSMAAVETVFRIFGRDVLSWTILSVMANSLFVLFIMLMAYSLTGRRSIAYLAGILLALFPNLTETYHFSTQVLNEVACALVFYALSGWIWVEYMRRGGGWRLCVSAIAYLVGLFAYEAGLLLPASYIFLLLGRHRLLKCVARLVPFGVAALLYVVWRTTDSFGLNQSWIYPPHMEAGISAGGILWNVRQMIHWWVGDNMAGNVFRGLEGFATLSPWTRRLLFAGNTAVVALVGWRFIRIHARDAAGEPPFSHLQSLLFSGAWTASAMVLCFLSYTAPRLNVLPAVGVALLVALLLVRVPMRTWGLLLFVPAVLSLAANQGTAESYRQAGALNQRLFMHLQETVDQWKNKEILLIDTSSIRQRLTPGLLGEASRDQMVWSQYRNALLFRGFSTRGMIMYILGEANPAIATLHDVENGARIDGAVVRWHGRFLPEMKMETPLEKSVIIKIEDLSRGE